MKITMFTIGSTGDVRPYVILGKELKRRGHEVKIACLAGFEEMITSNGLECFSMAGDVVKVMSSIMAPGVSGVKYLVQVEKAIRDVAPVLLEDLMEAAKGAECLVCNFFCNMYYSVAEYYNIPCVQTHFFPVDPRPDIPISSAPGLEHSHLFNRMSYRIGYLLISVLEKRYLTAWRKKWGMKDRGLHTKPDYRLMGHTIPAVYAVSPHVMPPSPTWPDNVQTSGFWWEGADSDYLPDEKLSSFLTAGEKPVYIGFGSMVSGDMRQTFDTVMQAVEKAGVRAVVSQGWAGENTCVTENENIMLVDDVPHDWLFSHVKAVVHHGGCGTTATGLRYGRPTLIIPFGGDQPFWGMRVYSIGCGPKPISREKLTADGLAHALRDLVSNKDYAIHAAELSHKLLAENGAARAADIIEEEAARWK